VKIRGCPAAVIENELRHSALVRKSKTPWFRPWHRKDWEATGSRNRREPTRSKVRRPARIRASGEIRGRFDLEASWEGKQVRGRFRLCVALEVQSTRLTLFYALARVLRNERSGTTPNDDDG